MKRIGFWLAASALVMLFLPWLAVTLINGPDGMAAVFLLFFAVDPVYSILVGLAAGKDPKSRWYLPIASAALFLAGVWAQFEPSETAFLLYAAGYLALGLSAMGLRALLAGKARR